MFIYGIVRRIIILMVLPIFRVRVHGRRNLSMDTGFVVVMNHSNFADPLYIMGISPVSVHFLAKKELFRPWPLGVLMRAMGQIPVDRQNGGNTGVSAETLVCLGKGEVVAVFPEGTRRQPHTPGWMKGHTGAVRFANEAGVPLVPCLITNDLDIFGLKRCPPRPRQISLYIGKPMRIKVDPEQDPGGIRREYRRITDRIMARLQREAEKRWLRDQ